MNLARWPHAESPWHDGELELQRRFGVAEAMTEVGARVIRAEMPAQHRELFARLPFVVFGAADRSARVWASMAWGAPGFVSAADPARLRVGASLDPGDPLAGALGPGVEVGLIGIEPETRRRNRANGRVGAFDASGWTLEVTQSFGNCPRFIRRRARLADAATLPRPVQRTSAIDAAAAALVERADTFFIATRAAAGRVHGGADVSHRGGRPGFVRVGRDGRSLAWPEFAGNRFFNTLGNLRLDSRAGLLFADWASGDLLQLSGRAEVRDADRGAAAETAEGAEQIVQFRVDAVVLRPAACPLRWQPGESAPELAGAAPGGRGDGVAASARRR